MKFNFYIRMDNTIFGPYSTQEIIEMDIPGDIEVMEESEKEWELAKHFPFTDYLAAEKGFVIEDDGSVKKIPSPPQTSTNPQPGPFSQTTTDESPKLGWNWGAFFFNWLWGIFNGVYWPLLMLIPSGLSYLYPAASIISFIMCIVLGIYGNEMAWSNKYWRNAKEFNETQHKWSIAVLWVIGASFGLGIILGLIESL
jgi:hypothetical protein